MKKLLLVLGVGLLLFSCNETDKVKNKLYVDNHNDFKYILENDYRYTLTKECDVFEYSVSKN